MTLARLMATERSLRHLDAAGRELALGEAKVRGEVGATRRLLG
jgi:hypothetical protein